MNRFALFLLLSLAWAGCKHHPDDPATGPKIYFTGLTQVDEQGQALANPDPTDWRLDDVWTAQESALFASPALPLCGTIPDSTIVYAAPNPCKKVFILGLSKAPSGATWRFRIVDENFASLMTYDAVSGANQVAINAASFPKDTLRVYYQLETAGCVWRGHGDVLVEN